MNKKKIVITLHGIRTTGKWQKALDTVLASSEFVPYALDYGYFDTLAFLNPWKREERVKWFRSEYDRIVNASGVDRPSIIAHSFGTYLTAEVLNNYPEVKFDKIIFAGSIVPPDYDWKSRLAADQVLFVHNEYATKDPWPKVAGWIPWLNAGSSGRNGFSTPNSTRFSQQGSPRGHEVAIFVTFFAKWVCLLRKPLLSQTDQESVQQILGLIPPILSKALNIQKENLRCNVFVEDEDGKDLAIPSGAYYNMNNPAECGITIPKGMGCTGKAFRDRRMHIAIFKDDWWGEHDLPPVQLQLVDHSLRWIISFPVLDPIDGRIRAIMNVDCLNVEKSLSDLGDESEGVQLNEQQHAVLRKMYGDIGTILKILSENLVSLEQGAL